MHSLSVSPRPETGKGAARKMRAAGRVPGVIYADGADARPVSFEPKALLDIFRATKNRNTIVHLELEGETFPVLVQDADRHPVSRELLHVDFLRVSDDKKLVVKVPVEGVGRPAGAALGGRLRLIRRELKVRCMWQHIPETLQVDITPMEIGDMVKAAEITPPPNVEVLYESNFNVLTVYGKKVRR
jgi:large subunit ribosomal protein L25